MSRVQVAAAALNQTVGDWEGNAHRASIAVERAKTAGASLLVLPEMCLSGYSLGDRLTMSGAAHRSWAALESLTKATADIIVVAGIPIRFRDTLFDAAVVCANGEIAGIVPKENLASGEVEYESRWFQGWNRGEVASFTSPDGTEIPIGSMVFEANGVGCFGVEICEDGWRGIRPGSRYALGGAHIIANLSASWFQLGKQRIRRHMVEQISRQDHAAYLYASLLGCDDTRLVFDGSTFIAQDGVIVREGDRFRFDDDVHVISAEIDVDALRRQRMKEASWRKQGARQRRDGDAPHRVVLSGTFGRSARNALDASPPAGPDPSLSWLNTSGRLRSPIGRDDLPFLELELAIATGLRDYKRKTGVHGFAVALSGGRDSAMVATIAARALAYDVPHDKTPAAVSEGLLTAYLSTDQSGNETRSTAADVARQLGSTHHEIDIQQAVEATLNGVEAAVSRPLSWDRDDASLQNVQARQRSATIWMLANLHQQVLLATSNQSEAAVGYATMDGDTSGGLAPISGIPKTTVEAWLRWAAAFHQLDSLERVCETPPTAELRPPGMGQTDEDDLMPYDVLDAILETFVGNGKEPVDVFEALWPRFATRYDRPSDFAQDIRRFFELFCRSQWKRERFPIGFRLTHFDLDPRTGFRFPVVQNGYTAELAELDAHVAKQDG